MIFSPASDKKGLRAQLIAARSVVAGGRVKEASISVSQSIRELLPKGVSVAGYMAMRGEVDVLPLFFGLAVEGNLLCLPVVSEAEKTLQFLAWTPGDALAAGAYGVACPLPGAARVVPQAVIVPLVGFDAQGNRLGYGAGHYDATIRHLRAENKQVIIIGAAYSVQQVESLPVEPHDERLDAVVTERSVFRFS